MSKKLFFVPLVFFLILLSSCVGRGYVPAKCDAAASYIYNEETKSYELYSFSAGTESPEEFVIPDSYDDGTNGTFPVTKILSFAFYNLYSVKKVVIPDSIKTIERGAFYDCSGLKEISIPGCVELVEESAFVNCPNVESIDVSIQNRRYRSENNCLIDKESQALLFGCNNSILPQDEITAICDYAFYGCKELSSVAIPDMVTTLGVFAFCDCSALSEVHLGKGIRQIGDRAFYGCAFESIALPDSVLTVGKGAFSHCENLLEIELGNGVVYLMEDAFSYCPALHDITIPRSVNYIGVDFVRGCSGLRWINFDGKKTYWYVTENRDEWISGSTRGLKPLHTSQSINANATYFASTDFSHPQKVFLIRGEDFGG